MNQNKQWPVKSNEQNHFANEPPKNKPDKIDNAVVNKQDDNSYEEPVTDNTTKQQDKRTETEKKKDFEYKDTDGFDNGSQITNTDSNDEYL